MKSAWAALPEEARNILLLGSVGRIHLAAAARACLEGGSADAAARMLLAAAGESPLNGGLAREILECGPVARLLDGPAAATLRAVAAAWRLPENVSYYMRLAARLDIPKLRAFLDTQIGRDPGNLFWRNTAVGLALYENDWAWARSCLDFPAPSGVEPARLALLAQVEHLAGDTEAAVRFYGQALPVYGPGFSLARQGLALAGSGRRDQGFDLLLQCLREAPWHSSVLLRASDMALGLDRERAPVPGRVRVLLYSWNKAADLDACLASLHASDLGEAGITVLNNGSSDGTSLVLDAWAGRFGPTFERVDLPVNIGAPAARNWLMHLPSTREADFAVYLDDDAEVPADWLGLLGAAVRRHPEAGVWGCKVVDHAAQSVMQSADLHLVLPPAGPEIPALDLESRSPSPFCLSDLHIQTLDLGFFDHMRPCASVTGCCHMFRTPVLLDNGGFSLRLSPSQYDDLEHDLRLAKSGRTAVYQGHLTVRHKKRTGAAARLPGREEGNAVGNRYKLQVMHPRAEIAELAGRERAVLREDLEKRLDALDGLAAGGRGERR